MDDWAKKNKTSSKQLFKTIETRTGNGGVGGYNKPGGGGGPHCPCINIGGIALKPGGKLERGGIGVIPKGWCKPGGNLPGTG